MRLLIGILIWLVLTSSAAASSSFSNLIPWRYNTSTLGLYSRHPRWRYTHRRRRAGRLSLAAAAWLSGRRRRRRWAAAMTIMHRPIFPVIIIVLKNRLNLPFLSSQFHIVVCNGINILLNNDAGLFLCFFKLQKYQISLSNRLMCLKIELNAMETLL